MAVMTWSVHGYDGNDGYPKRWSFYERHGDTYIPHCGVNGLCTNDKDKFVSNCRRSLMEHSAAQRESYISKIVVKGGKARFYVSDFIQNWYARNETEPYRYMSCAGPDDEED